MIIAVLVLFGLCLGSFVNALVWRIYEQDKRPPTKSKRSKAKDKLSVVHGRSMCPHCKHELAMTDLVPVFSWLFLEGKCRYCHKAISSQYPLVEIATALLFVASYVWWPKAITGDEISIFALWLVILTGLIALFIYDLRWFLLPDRLVFPLMGFALAMTIVSVSNSHNQAQAIINAVAGVAIGGGLFYVLFQVSAGKWIGGGDVKLGWLLGLIVATPARSLLLIFIASVVGSLSALPLLLTKRLKARSIIPFGPFLIIAVVIVQLFGADILDWYKSTFLTF